MFAFCNVYSHVQQVIFAIIGNMLIVYPSYNSYNSNGHWPRLLTQNYFCRNDDHREDLVEPALRATLKDLGLEYIDCFLVGSRRCNNTLWLTCLMSLLHVLITGPLAFHSL